MRREDGFALPLALSMMVIVAMLAGVTISFATHNTDRATRDSAASRAFGAADAGIDAALYRMNKALVASQAQGVVGVPTAVMAEARCVSIAVGQISIVEPVDGWCAATAGGEEIDGPSTAGQAWRTASFTHSVSAGVNIGTASAPLIERKVVATGTVGDVTKRVQAVAHAQLGSSGNLLKVFEQVGYKQCKSAAPASGDPSSNC